MTATIATPARAVKTTAGVEFGGVAAMRENLPLRPVLAPAATERMAVVSVLKWEEDVFISSHFMDQKFGITLMPFCIISLASFFFIHIPSYFYVFSAKRG